MDVKRLAVVNGNMSLQSLARGLREIELYGDEVAYREFLHKSQEVVLFVELVQSDSDPFLQVMNTLTYAIHAQHEPEADPLLLFYSKAKSYRDLEYPHGSRRSALQRSKRRSLKQR